MTIDKIKTDLTVTAKDIQARAGHLSAEAGRVRTLANDAGGNIKKRMLETAGRIASQSGDISLTAKRVQWMADGLPDDTVQVVAPHIVEAAPHSIKFTSDGLLYQRVAPQGEMVFVANPEPGKAAYVTGLPAGVEYRAYPTTSDGVILTTERAGVGEPWTIDSFPDSIVLGVRLRDLLAEGRATLDGYSPVGMFGWNKFVAPTVSVDEHGIRFGGARYKGRSNSGASVRVVAVVFKGPPASATAHIINVAGKDGNWRRQPSMYVEKGRLVGHWDMPGARDIKVICNGVVPDRWNVAIISHAHDGHMAAQLNGRMHDSHNNPAARFVAPSSEEDWTFGGGAEIYVRDLLTINGARSEKWVRKLAASLAAEAGALDLFPADHPYRHVAPMVEADDIHHAYKFDDAEWKGFVSTYPKNSPKLFVRRGLPVEPLVDHTPVMLDDFRQNSVGSSNGHNSKFCIWFGAGHNPAVGGDSGGENPFMPNPLSYPENYLWLPDKQQLQLVQSYDPKTNKWRVPAIYSVNDFGRGRAWAGGYTLRQRIMFDKVDDPEKTLGESFWAFGWGYDLGSLIWRNLLRLEYDFVEPHAKGRAFANWSTFHNHEAFFPGENPKPVKEHELVDGHITKAKGWPFDIEYWDGIWKVWECHIGPEWCIMSVDMTGATDPYDRSGLVELFRFPTPRFLLEKRYVINNTSIQRSWSSNWQPAKETQQLDHDGNRLFANGKPLMEPAKYRFWHDWIVVEQPTAVVEALPAPFADRAKIARQGNKLVLNVPLSEPLRYVDAIWHVDAYPMAEGLEWTPPAGTKGKVRALVKASGHTDMPEAWSDVVTLS